MHCCQSVVLYQHIPNPHDKITSTAVKWACALQVNIISMKSGVDDLLRVSLMHRIFLTELFSLFLRKAVRATIVLLPLFGLDWLLTVYRPSNSDGGGCIWPILHRYLIVILSGARGLMVSIVFCYRNGEVILIIYLLKFQFLLIERLP